MGQPCPDNSLGHCADDSRQLVDGGDLDYLVFDYLAEITMSILARARAKDESLGYATDFVAPTMKSLAKDIRSVVGKPPSLQHGKKQFDT